MSEKEIVTVICYGKAEKMERKKAIDFYTTAVLCSEGSERDRYSKILAELLDNRKICTDGQN